MDDNSGLWAQIAADVEQVTGQWVDVDTATSGAGGGINRTCVIGRGARRLFVKLNDPQHLAMFEAEAEGLKLLATPGRLRVPAPVCLGSHSQGAYLVLEHIVFGRGDAAGEAALGEGLAAVHGVIGERFGWDRDNTIGTTPQRNGQQDDWRRFYAQQRLGYQLDLAERNGYGRAVAGSGRRLVEAVPRLLDGHSPAPSLVHGDLWGGNAAFDESGRPVIFDPAVYFGDRETDLAMTELFGGFGPAFYDAYSRAWPLQPGYPVRRDLYQLYHVLNHLNLFGAGYRVSAQRLIERLLSQAG